ncbi:MAG TPA: sigma-70 family RNA polymerase sigma factor [Candidatus Saccharimonadales bacterium]|jgi:RNA polymerase sigma-70 factor (ECF subfamily)|nr:sigma-70 family RNA polymerase sigma factor [Candidatus Saccharimonadales bacterium]
MQIADDAGLIARSKQGDQQAFAELVDRYKNAVYHHSFAIVRDEDVAEDIAQDTFISAYYNLHQYDPAYRLATWLFKIATNKALNYLKRAAREVAADDDVIASVAATGPGPHDNSERAELRDAVNRLQPRYRAAISLYYWQGLSYQEIAAAMGSPLGSVKVWMARAKAELRRELS